MDYELILLVSPQVADEQVGAVTEKFTGFVTNKGGTVTTVNPWGRRRLAYHIKDFQEATYVQANFTLDSKAATELTNQLNISEEVIRYLLTRAHVAKPAKEAAVAKA